MRMKKGRVTTHGESAFDEVLRGRSPVVQQIARLARDAIAETLPEIVEVCWPKQGTAGYGTGPRKMSEQFCYVAPQKAHVNLGFFYGADLSDPAGLLEGTGRLLRHVKLRGPADLEKRELRSLLRAASRHLPRL